ncbi:MAG TPA: hypothetical protein VIL52_05765 [Bacteroidota bacterium]
MPTDLIAGLIVFAIVVLLILGTVSMVRNPKKSAGIAMQTAFQDFLPKDKQQAMEIVMEQKDQKKMKEQESKQGE